MTWEAWPRPGLGSAAELVTHGTARDAAFSPSRPGSAPRPDVSPCLESVMGWGPPEGTPRWRCACAWFIREATAESAAGSEEASRVEQGRQRGVLMRGRLPARLGLRAVGGIAWRPWARRPQRPRVLLFQPAARRLRRAPGRGSRVPAGVLCWHPGDSGRRGDTGGTPMASLIEREGGEEGRDGACGFREPAAPETALNSAPRTAVARPVRRG